ncbi:MULTISPECIES: hypothetical protein [unclassified Methanosarcina]|uniref:hypothetical protein n=1 Tax=unclassified Methanosarcina TaxID=2644672 RepID=UPI0006158056|nr:MULTISPECIES: hypothetical protein [unclassified Methanosarcina]AKB18191.1 hypothetical protein MSWHS_1328 [Methanosarcina sp. WWM596]AKB21523.1 hypothetical protein MSWH1_1252 [Methanosarcina sp. WH1]
MYNETPFSSASFEKSIEALKVAKRFNYSTVFGTSPYSEDIFDLNNEEAPLFCRWLNRNVFEFFNKADSENVMKPSP